MNDKKIVTIGLAKETESPENPGGLEKRVAMIPKDIKTLVESGCQVFFENGAGEGVGYSDDEYLSAGATLQNSEQIYKDKDMVLKFKGPSLENTAKMTSGTILFCIAHFRSFPERAQLMEDCKINVIAMENILESPKYIPDDIILSKRFVEEKLSALTAPYEELHIGFLGYHSNMVGGIRRAGNRNPRSQNIYQKDIQLEEIKHFGNSAIYYYDSRVFTNTDLISELKSQSCQLFDLKEFEENRGRNAIEEYRETHPPFEFGGRRIQCLHETGMAGARSGFRLHEENKDIRPSVLGYGNVGMGAIRECYDQGARTIQILGRTHTHSDNIGNFIKDSNLIINGAEQAPELRGVNYLIKSDYVGSLIKKGSVVIDLIGGSATNRSPVEDIVECSYLTDPHFSRDGVKFSGLWGWPMMGMMKESAVTYSGQILEVMIGREKLLKGLEHLAPGVKPALVCGPH
jgi:alanine dehydrogenase